MKNWLIVLLSIIVLASCSDSRQKELDQITALENLLNTDSARNADVNRVYNLHIAYNGFADRFPKDSLAPVFLFRGGDMCVGMKWKKQAIEFFERLRSEYPDYPRTADALFLEAFVYDDQVKDYAKAGELYRLFIEKYPNHPFAKDAEASLNMLGKSNEDLIKEFEENLKADSAATVSAVK
jgi:tetratricopeptide (TPR) repeat protein